MMRKESVKELLRQQRRRWTDKREEDQTNSGEFEGAEEEDFFGTPMGADLHISPTFTSGSLPASGAYAPRIQVPEQSPVTVIIHTPALSLLANEPDEELLAPAVASASNTRERSLPDFRSTLRGEAKDNDDDDKEFEFAPVHSATTVHGSATAPASSSRAPLLPLVEEGGSVSRWGEEAEDDDVIEMPDDTDFPNDVEEYEAWSRRQSRRLANI